MLGVGLGLIAFVPVSLLFGTQMGAVVSLSVATICTFAVDRRLVAATPGGPPRPRPGRAVGAVHHHDRRHQWLVIYFLIAKVILGV